MAQTGASPGANDEASSKYSLDGKSTHYSGRFLAFLDPSVLLDANKLEVFAERSEIWPVHVQWAVEIKAALDSLSSCAGLTRTSSIAVQHTEISLSRHSLCGSDLAIATISTKCRTTPRSSRPPRASQR